jgi:hypothetical protein
MALTGVCGWYTGMVAFSSGSWIFTGAATVSAAAGTIPVHNPLMKSRIKNRGILSYRSIKSYPVGVCGWIKNPINERYRYGMIFSGTPYG